MQQGSGFKALAININPLSMSELMSGETGWHAMGKDRVIMNTPNAFGFFGAGVMMELLRLLPDVTGVREMWLLLMGAVMLLTGTVFLLQAGWGWFAPRMVTPLVTALGSRRQEAGDARPVAADGRRAGV
jgi:hypothetical protein